MAQTTTLAVVAGLPGAGKSVAASMLAEILDAVWLRTDVIRKELFPKPTYHPAESQAVYDEFFRRAEETLAEGRSVVMDATFVLRKGRRRARRLAEQVGARFMLLLVTAPEEVIRQRLVQRTGDPSDADFQVYQRLKAEFEPITCPHVVIDNEGDLADLRQKLEQIAAA